MTPAQELVSALGGKWHGQHGMARCVVHDDRNPSLSIRDGDTAPLVTCHAGCDRRTVIDVLRRRNLWPDGERKPNPSPATKSCDRNQQHALDIWGAAWRIDGTPAARYLIARGITIPPPPSLRWHRGLKHKPTGLVLPALVAAIQAPDRSTCAIQRTFLVADGRGKAPVSDPKLTLGALGRGAVRLAAAAEMLGLAEGIETALSAMQLFNIPCWASLGGERMSKVELPEIVRHVVIFGDNGGPGRAAAMKAVETYTAQRRKVTLRFPPADFGDWNDCLRAQQVKK